MGQKETPIENYLRDRVKHEGGEIRKVKWLGRDGAPDRLIWWSGPRFAFVECKAPGEEVEWRSAQGREIRRLREDGFAVYVVDSREAVDTMIVEVKGRG